MNPWTPGSWRNPPLITDQQVDWPDVAAKDEVLKQLKAMPPLIFAGEARRLKAELARAANGEAFVLQAGDCAETFEDFSADRVRDGLKVMLQMAAVLTFSADVPVVKIGRVAGQFAKPRSSQTETMHDVTLPSYRGDMINRVHFSHAARTPDPANILHAYHQAAATLNLLRSFTKGGFAKLSSVHAWNMEFVAASPEGRRYENIAGRIDSALRFMKACGLDPETAVELQEVDFYTSHEALVLDYEEALTRQDSTADGEWYDCSAAMLWLGTRTKGLDDGHIEFLRGIGNPLGCKVDPSNTPEEIVEICERLDPDREPGRLTLISRMGRAKVEDNLEPLIRAVSNAGHKVVWMCDPMHGNTTTASNGLKTRDFDDILEEITHFFHAHEECGTWPGGIHLEMTGDNVPECTGGGMRLGDSQLNDNYRTTCDPRLNAQQSLDLAFRVAELLEDFV